MDTQLFPLKAGLPLCPRRHGWPSASSIASEAVPYQVFEPIPLQPLVVVAEACSLLGTRKAMDMDKLCSIAKPIWLSKSPLIPVPQPFASNVHDLTVKVSPSFEPLGCFPPRAVPMEDGKHSIIPDFNVVIDFFDAQAGDNETQVGLYRCATERRLSIKEKLAMMQRAVAS
jgi:hypothetical protein